MKPHRRKPSSPRRTGAPPQHGETGAGPAEEAGAPVHGAPGAETAPAYPPASEIPYDPAAAFAETDAVAPPESGAPAQPPDSEISYDPGAAFAETDANAPPQMPAAPTQAPMAPLPGEPSAFAPGVYDEAPPGVHAPPPGPVPAPAPFAPPAAAANPAMPAAAPAAGGAGGALRRAPGKRPATPRTRTGYRPPKPSYGGGFSPMSIFMVIAALGLIWLIVTVMRPVDLSGVQGYPQDTLAAGSAAPRNLLDEAQRAMLDRGEEFVVSEAEFNLYLNTRLEGVQKGLVSSLVAFRGIYVDFSPGFAEIFIEREVFGMPITKSCRIRSETARRQTQYRVVSWSIGKLDLGTRNVKPVMDLFSRIRAVCSEEWLTLQQMPEVRFEENRVVIDPRI